jgi:hypothetical protein
MVDTLHMDVLRVPGKQFVCRMLPKEFCSSNANTAKINVSRIG